jgi:hypothetical protein
MNTSDDQRQQVPFVIVDEHGDTLAMYRGCDAEIWHRNNWMNDYILEVYWPDNDVSQSSHASVEAALSHFTSIVDDWHTLQAMDL